VYIQGQAVQDRKASKGAGCSGSGSASSKEK
jgi:hypothetical protein